MCNCNRPVCNGCQQAKPMAQPHKWADVIKAWADGAEIEYYQNISGKWANWRDGFTMTNYIPFCDEKSPYQFRVKPKQPTLGEIAKAAWQQRRDTCGPPISSWDRAAAAVKKAIESGEYSEASGEHS